ncbi:MAG: translation initiation factor IF-2 N-terminal domain-containing protein [Gallintestinimicrobium sp.]
MAKIKVHELAKELEIKSKDVITFLQEKGVDVKAAQSSIEGDAVEWVKRSSQLQIRSRPIKRTAAG